MYRVNVNVQGCKNKTKGCFCPSASLYFMFVSSKHLPLSLLYPSPRLLFASDYIIKEKTVLLQKKDSEGFGFVLRGAKGKKTSK